MAVDKVARHYSDQWDLLGSFRTVNLAAREQSLLDAVPFDKTFFSGKAVLVAGCAYGWEALIFHRLGSRVTGVDLFTEAAVEFLDQAGAAPSHSGIQILRQDLEQLDLPADSFDYIHCDGILHHTPQTELALSRLVRVLKPGGHLVLGLYGSGGYLWAMVHAGRFAAQILSLVGVRQKQLASLLSRIPMFRGVWSRRFEGETVERIVWTTENLYVPILKHFTPAQVEGMLAAEDLTNFLRRDTFQGRFVSPSEYTRLGIFTRMKYGTFYLRYAAQKRA